MESKQTSCALVGPVPLLSKTKTAAAVFVKSIGLAPLVTKHQEQQLESG